VVDVGEECDDGDDPQAKLDNTDSCLDNCRWNKCGDGAWYRIRTDARNPNPVEECDDSYADNRDECLDTCAYNTCGDGNVFDHPFGSYGDPDGKGPKTPSPGPEMTTYLCSIYPGFELECDGSTSPNTTAGQPAPGDGDNRPDHVRNLVPEECDDGNTDPSDGCSNTCMNTDP